MWLATTTGFTVFRGAARYPSQFVTHLSQTASPEHSKASACGRLQRFNFVDAGLIERYLSVKADIHDSLALIYS